MLNNNKFLVFGFTVILFLLSAVLLFVGYTDKVVLPGILAYVDDYSTIYTGKLSLIVMAVVFFSWGITLIIVRQLTVILNVGKLLSLALFMICTPLFFHVYYIDLLFTWSMPFGVGGVIGSQVYASLVSVLKDTYVIEFLGPVWIFLLFLEIILFMMVTGFYTNAFMSFSWKFCFLPGYWIYLGYKTFNFIYAILGNLVFARSSRRDRTSFYDMRAVRRVTSSAGDDGAVEAEKSLFGMSDKIEERSLSVLENHVSWVLPRNDCLERHLEGNAKLSLGELKVLADNVKQAFNTVLNTKGDVINIVEAARVVSMDYKPEEDSCLDEIDKKLPSVIRLIGIENIRVVCSSHRSVISVDVPSNRGAAVKIRCTLSDLNIGVGVECTGLILAMGEKVSPLGVSSLSLDLIKVSHILIAGNSGSGKRKLLDNILISLLLQTTPDKLKFIMMDSTKTELATAYSVLPFLLSPVITDVNRAEFVLQCLQSILDGRLEQLMLFGARNIRSYNTRVQDAARRNKQFCMTKGGKNVDLGVLPYIVVFIHELSLFLGTKHEKDILDSLHRLTHMGRAVGIHVIVTTDCDVGVIDKIKKLFSTRICLRTNSVEESKEMLGGDADAVNLMGDGDALILFGPNKCVRFQSAFASDEEINKVVSLWNDQGLPNFDCNFQKFSEGDDTVEVYGYAVELVREHKKCTCSFLQKKLGISYVDALKIISQMEQNGIVSEADYLGQRIVNI